MSTEKDDESQRAAREASDKSRAILGDECFQRYGRTDTDFLDIVCPTPVSAVVPVPAENQTAISAGKLKMRKNLVASLIDKCISVHPMDGTYLARIFKTEALNVN